MSVKVQVSQLIDRPLEQVFQFFAHDHVRNHPRWDPQMELEQVSDGPIGVGTIIRRRNSHSGTAVEGTIEVVEFEPNRLFGTVIHEGPIETYGRVTFDPEDPNRTLITMIVELPGMDQSADTTMLKGLMERSARNIKGLIESEDRGNVQTGDSRPA